MATNNKKKENSPQSSLTQFTVGKNPVSTIAVIVVIAFMVIPIDVVRKTLMKQKD